MLKVLTSREFQTGFGTIQHKTNSTKIFSFFISELVQPTMALTRPFLIHNSLHKISQIWGFAFRPSSSFKTDLHTDQLYPGSNFKDRFCVKKIDPKDHPVGYNGVINFDEVKVCLISWKVKITRKTLVDKIYFKKRSLCTSFCFCSAVGNYKIHPGYKHDYIFLL